MPNFNEMPELNVCLLSFSALVTLFLLLGVATEHGKNRPFIRNFICLLIAHILMQLGEAGLWFFAGTPEKVGLLKLSAVFSIGVGLFVNVFFTYCMLEFFREREKVSLLPAHIVAIVALFLFFLTLISVFYGIFFRINERGYFTDGPYAYAIYLFDFGSFLLEVYLILRYRRFLTMRGRIALLSYCTLPFIAMELLVNWYPVPMYLTTTLSLIVLVILFQGELTRQLAEKEKELNESKIAIMVSQIQPHFLYNSLNSIYHLCDKDIQLAKKTISDFSEYLRNILGSINRTAPISFEKELQYVQTYLNLEQLRFGEDLHVVYQIEATGFFLPALSVQPLVENAVKHGVLGREDGGTLILSTKECTDCYQVIVSDNGVGFDVTREPEDGRLHVGIQNVRQRLYAMCGATLTIESEPGKGTIATICVPRKEEADEDTCGRR